MFPSVIFSAPNLFYLLYNLTVHWHCNIWFLKSVPFGSTDYCCNINVKSLNIIKKYLRLENVNSFMKRKIWKKKKKIFISKTEGSTPQVNGKHFSCRISYFQKYILKKIHKILKSFLHRKRQIFFNLITVFK